jgi:hypothetical protein
MEMKKALSVLLVIVMCSSLCACGTETTTQEKNNEAITAGQSEATISTETEVQETTESIVYAESFFKVEEIVYEMFNNDTPEFGIKIRNTSTEKITDFFFSVQLLDKNGDILDNKDPMGIDTLDAGQAFWLEVRWLDRNGYKTIQEFSEDVESIKIVSATIKRTGVDYSKWDKYEFEKPATFKVADIQQKN